MSKELSFQLYYYWIPYFIILIATIYFINKSAINAVKTGRRLDNESQKDATKRDLFLMLFSYRGVPTHEDFVNGLNQIDVVFQDTETVLKAWHELYDALYAQNRTDLLKHWELLRVDLLSAMAVSLGYNKLNQTVIQRVYIPQYHIHVENTQTELDEAELAYYKSGIAMNQKALERMIRLDQLDKSTQEEIL